MRHFPAPFWSSRGISIIGIIILIAVLVAALNAYSYFNPDFQLARYSIVRLLKSKIDEQRKVDIGKIQEAVEKYYDDNNEYPARDDWCGRIVSVLHPEAKDALSAYFGNGGIPQDPSFQGTSKDYLYKRIDKKTYVLMAVLENVPSDTPTYKFTGCHDWPGDSVYNYRVIGER